MTMDSQWAVQTAVYDVLKDTATLTDLLAAGAAGIYDHVPSGAQMPYVVMTGFQGRPFSTQQSDGMELELSLSIWSDYQGQKEIKDIMSAISDVLHESDFTVAGQNLVLCRLNSAEIKLTDQGHKRQGVQKFRILTEPA